MSQTETGLMTGRAGHAMLASGAADESENVSISITMTPVAFAMLDTLASSSGQRLQDVIGKAFLLYKAAHDARCEGKAVGIATTADSLETEFVGL